jgi:hypothetical protein
MRHAVRFRAPRAALTPRFGEQFLRPEAFEQNAYVGLPDHFARRMR